MNTLTKTELLRATDPKRLIDAIIEYWPNLDNEEQQELCLEEIYELLAQHTPTPENFSLLSSDQKAQYEIDIDMLLITIYFKDIGDYVFKEEKNIEYFWSVVPKTEKSKAIFQKLFKLMSA